MMHISRRGLLLGGSVLAASSILRPRMARANPGGVRVGAIRWDAWYTTTVGSSGFFAEACIGTDNYQFRAPWWATPINSRAMDFTAGNTQATMDAEITYAQNAGVKYWAFNWASSGNSLLAGWLLYQSSTLKANVNWCVLADYAQFIIDMSAGLASTYVGYFQQSNYEKVITTRPLLYLLNDGTNPASVTASLTALRSACTTAGIAQPYVVVMAQSGYAAAKTTIGADAVSCYALNPSGVNQPYSALDTATQAFWAAQAATGPMIPIGMTGFDRRPMVDRPVPWEVATQVPRMGDNIFFATATPAQIATHVQAGLTFIGANPSACPANNMLLYAWNEHSEGGWICPTYTISGPDHTRLDALSAVIP